MRTLHPPPTAPSPRGAVALVACTLALIFAASPALADDAAPGPRSKLAGIIHPLDWGASVEDVFGKLKSEMDERYRDQMKTSDTIKIDRLIRQKADEMKRVRDSLMRFDGQRTGYETSLVAGEVVPREGESLVRVDDRVAQRYYIFRNDQIWKVVVTYNVSSMGSFTDFVGAVKAKYGNPKKASFSDDDGERRITSVTWEDDHTRMVVEDQSEFYSSYVMKFVQVGRGTDLETARANRPKVRKTAADSRAEGLMGDIFEDDSGASDDLVDEITGVEATVDLTSGREQQYAVPAMVEDTAPAAEKKPRGKRGKKPARKKDAPAPSPDIIF